MKSIKKWPYIFITPYFLIYLVFGLSPVIYSLCISFTDWDGIGKMRFVGFDNYLRLFSTDPYFFKSILNTMILMIGYLPVLIIGGLLLAVAVYNKGIKGKQYFQLANFLPYITTPVAIGIIFSLLFDWQTGMVNRLLMQTGLISEGINWLGKVWTARLIIILMVIWKYLGYSMVIFLAGLTNISTEIYEAAYVDGSGRANTFFKITLPLLKPVMLFMLITSIIGGFQLLEEPMLLLAGWNSYNIGGPEGSCLTVVWNLYDTAFGSSMKYGYGAAIAYGLFLIIVFFSMMGMKITNRGGNTE